MVKRGGRHQTRASESSSTRPRVGLDVQECPLVLTLLTKLAWGQLSASAVQEIAFAAMQSGLTDRAVTELASAGSFGQYPGNVWRDIMSKFMVSTFVPQPTTILLPCVSRKEPGKVLSEPTLVLLPDQWVASISKNPVLMDEVFGTGQLQSFWQGVHPHDPRLLHTGLKSIANFERRCIPVLVHSDAGEYSESDSLFVLSMRALTSSGPTKQCQLLLGSFPRTCKTKGESGTIAKMFAAMVDSFNACFQGRTLDGQHFSSGCCLVIWCIGGDVENLIHEHRLPHFATKAGMCGFCKANYEELPFTDSRPEARWKATVYDHAALMVQPWATKGFFKIEGVIPETLHFDAMHLIECQGVANHTIANCLHEMIFASGLGKERGTHHVWSLMQKAYVDLGIQADDRMGHFVFARVGDDGAPHAHYPCLSSVKARHCRYLVKVVTRLLEEAPVVDGNEHNAHRLLCMRNLAMLCDIIDRNQWFLSDAEHGLFSTCVQHFLVHYQWLNKEAARARKCLWSITPKFHFMHHLVDQAKFLSPKATRLYGSEDMVGRMAKLGASCLSGNPSHSVPSAIIVKYRLAMHLLLEYQVE